MTNKRIAKIVNRIAAGDEGFFGTLYYTFGGGKKKTEEHVFWFEAAERVKQNALVGGDGDWESDNHVGRKEVASISAAGFSDRALELIDREVEDNWPHGTPEEVKHEFASLNTDVLYGTDQGEEVIADYDDETYRMRGLVALGNAGSMEIAAEDYDFDSSLDRNLENLLEACEDAGYVVG